LQTHFQAGPDITLTRVVEQEVAQFDPLTFFPTLTPELLAENRHWLEPDAIDPATGLLRLTIQSYVVQTPHHTILVDTCVGNHKDRPKHPFWNQKTDTTFLTNLAAAGVRPDQIDYVLCTHLHVDHVGWNTRLENGRWVPTFPRAKYIFGAREFAHWEAAHAREPSPIMADSVLPIIEAGRAELVSDTHMLGDHLTLTPTPGHSPGHVAVELGNDNRTHAVLTGDLIHSPLQARYPELGMRVDTDPVLGGATRRRFLECHCDTRTLVCTAHFAAPSVGHVTRWGEGFRFTAV
jgi:glyoxylase-like metal-dependent hydrolase (beta-lactamase superfamily II)